jgi:hypothetical protein
VTSIDAVHPVAVVVPVIVYVVVTLGVTFILVPLNEPGIHEYVSAPVADNKLLPPIHIDDGVADAVNTGNAFTFARTGVLVALGQYEVEPVDTLQL